MNTQVLYLSYDGMTDPLGQSQVLPYLRQLTKKGYQFTLISFEKRDRFEKHKMEIQQLCDEVGIQWYPLSYTKTPPVLSTLKDLIILKNTIKTLHSIKHFSLVHSRSYVMTVAGLWMKKKWGTKLVFDMRGFWADERVDGGLWDLKNPVYRTIYRYFKRKEREFLMQADYTISLTENAKKEIGKWGAQKSFAPIEVIPCCADLDLFNPFLITEAEIRGLKQRLNLTPSRVVVSYIGSVGTWYMAGEMLDFFKTFLKTKPDAVFLIVTKDDKSEIEKRVTEQEIPLSSIRIVSGQRNEMPLLVSISDFSIFFIKPVFSKKASSPTKQGEIMAMGVPLLCNDKIGDTSEIVRNFRAGVVINNFSEESYIKAIQEMFTTGFDKTAIREGAQSCYSLERGVEKYAAVYERILK